MARGAASVLNFNAAVILIPVCRNLINAMRGCFESIRSVRRLFDKNILFHKWCAYVICLFAAIHIAAHMFNVNRLATTKNPKADIMVDDNDTAETIAFTSVSAVPVEGVRTPFCGPPACLSTCLSQSLIGTPTPSPV